MFVMKNMIEKSKKIIIGNEDRFEIIGVFERFNVTQVELMVIITGNGKT